MKNTEQKQLEADQRREWKYVAGSMVNEQRRAEGKLLAAQILGFARAYGMFDQEAIGYLSELIKDEEQKVG